MAELFTRDGSPAPGPVTLNDKGKPECVHVGPCKRCNGAGGWTGWADFTCYACGGQNSMHQRTVVRLYTREELARLDASAERRSTQKASKRAAQDAARKALVESKFGALIEAARPYLSRNTFISDVVGKAYQYGDLSAAQVAALNNAVNYELAKDAGK